MGAFKQQLELIQVVNNNYNHIQQLESLSKLYKDLKETDYSKQYPSEYSLTQDEIDKLYLICKTTHNSHYDYRLFTSEQFKNLLNHVDTVLISVL